MNQQSKFESEYSNADVETLAVQGDIAVIIEGENTAELASLPETPSIREEPGPAFPNEIANMPSLLDFIEAPFQHESHGQPAGPAAETDVDIEPPTPLAAANPQTPNLPNQKNAMIERAYNLELLAAGRVAP